jgi:Na+-driven multidrug efflux pump
MRITIWCLPSLGVWQPMSCALRATGQFAGVARAGICATLLSAGLAVLLVTRLGLLGACLSWVVRPALGAACLLPLFMRAFPPVLPRVPLGRILASTAAMAVPLWLSTMRHAPALPALVTGVLSALVTYVGALMMLQVVQTSQLAGWLRPRSDSP